MKAILIFLYFCAAVSIASETVKAQPKSSQGMVYVPAGNFIMGSKYGDPDERPQHIAQTKAFFIDKFEKIVCAP